MNKRIFLVLGCMICSYVGLAQVPCENGMAGEYPCNNIDLLAFVPLSEIGGGDNTNDIWGWVSPVTGKEYALVGCNNGTAFLDISDPVNPIYLGLLPPHTVSSLWRDLETYNNYCFIGSEAPGHGLQIFNLLQLDTITNPPLTFTETAHYNGFGNSHTVVIDTLNGYLYAPGSDTYNGGLHIVDISNPMQPTLAGGFALEGYTHDCFVWNYDGPDVAHQGRQIVFACNGSKLAVVDCTDKTDCESLGSYTYPDLGYVHQGWVTKDKKHFVLNDELDEINFANNQNPIGTRTHLFNIEDLDNLVYMGFVETENSAIDHNMYIIDQLIYESNYRSGVRIVDAVRVADGDLNEVAYFDLYPQNDAPVFSGTWSNYAFLPSGVNIATSMYEGFFILKPNVIVPSQTTWNVCNDEAIQFELDIRGELAFPLQTAISGVDGLTVTDMVIHETGVYELTIDQLETLGIGTYPLQLELQTNFGEVYEVPLSITISNTLPDEPVITYPTDGSVVINSLQAFTWQSVGTAQSYEVQLAEDAAFTSVIEEQTVGTNAWLVSFDELLLSNYWWRVRAINSCGAGEWSTPEQFSLNLSHVALGNDIQRLALFPNPAHNTITIIVSNSIGDWRISDITGRTALSGFTTQSKQTVDLSSLATGVYLFKTNSQVIRFMKE